MEERVSTMQATDQDVSIEARSDSRGPKALVVVPTYNEADNIEELVDRVLGQPADIEILIVDDNSPDGTAAMVEAIARRDQRVHLLSRPGKMGLGSAYVAGFTYALEKTDVDLVVQMDADFSHDPVMIPKFMEMARDVDLVLGSRYLNGVTVINWPLSRLFLSYGANLYTRIITGLSFMDATGGFKCWRREVLQSLDLESIRSDGYSFQIETTYVSWRRGFRIREVPIIFADRRVGVSKMNRRIVIEAIFLVWRLAIRHLFCRRPVEREPVPLTIRSREAR